MLFHNGAKNTPEALPKVIEKLQADGYRFVPVSELIYQDNYTIDHRGKQISGGTPAETPPPAVSTTPMPEVQVPNESD